MNDWRLIKLVYLSEGLTNSNNMGQIPIKAKFKKTFLNSTTGELVSITDLQSKLHKRNKFIKLFMEVYLKHFKNKSISILSFVVYPKKYDSITKFTNTISRKLKREGISRLGYVWVRDIGDKKFEKHFHYLLATSRIDKVLFKKLFRTKKQNDYKVVFITTDDGMANYINKKDLYGEKKQRSFGKSRQFPIKLIKKVGKVNQKAN
jgi:hypothetical protein